MSFYSPSYLFNTSAERYQDVGFYAHWSVVLFVECVVFLGLLLTITVGIALHKDPVLFKSFAFMCKFQSIVDAQVLMFHFAYSIPIFAVRDRDHVPDMLEKQLTSFYAGSLFFIQNALIALIAVNRYLAITRPELYNKVFAMPNCRKLVVGCVLYGAIPISLYHVPCPVWWDIEHYLLAYDLGDGSEAWPCGYSVLIGLYIHGGPAFLTSLTATFLSIRAVRRRAKETAKLGGNNHIGQAKLARQRRTLKQSALNCMFQVVGLVVFNQLSPIMAHQGVRLPVLLTNTLTWCVAHMFNSIVLFVYNPSIRARIFCRAATVGHGRSSTAGTSASSLL